MPGLLVGENLPTRWYEGNLPKPTTMISTPSHFLIPVFNPFIEIRDSIREIDRFCIIFNVGRRRIFFPRESLHRWNFVEFLSGWQREETDQTSVRKVLSITFELTVSALEGRFTGIYLDVSSQAEMSAACVWPELRLQARLSKRNSRSMKHKLDLTFCYCICSWHTRRRAHHWDADFLAHRDKLTGFIAIHLTHLRRRVSSFHVHRERIDIA